MPRFAANLGFLFPEIPFTERFGAASAAGFAAVEFAQPYSWDARELAELVLGLGISHSRTAYAKPNVPKIGMLNAMMDAAREADPGLGK